MRTLIPAAAVASLLALSATAFAATKSVTVGDNFFVRDGGKPTVSVARGDTVVWRFRGKAPHNVRVTRGPQRFRSPVKRSGTYARRMTTSGTYTIVCTIHGARDQSMTLRVR